VYFNMSIPMLVTAINVEIWRARAHALRAAWGRG
jgi:hypothetical protein